MVIGDAFPQSAIALNLAFENQRAGGHIGTTVGGEAIPEFGFGCSVVLGKSRQPNCIYAHRSEIDRAIPVQGKFARTPALCFHHGKEHIRIDAVCSCFVDEAFQRGSSTDSGNQGVPLQRRAERRDSYIGRRRRREVREQDEMESFRLSNYSPYLESTALRVQSAGNEDRHALQTRPDSHLKRKPILSA